MILFGCLLAFGAAVAPRVILIFAWLFSDRWHLVWQGDWIMPLLGIIFLPYTTIMYLLTWTFVGGIEGLDWLWIILGLFLDFMKWSQMFANRKEATERASGFYPSGAPRGGSVATAAATPTTPAPPAAPAVAEAPAAASPTPADKPSTEPPAAPEDGSKDADLEQLRASGALSDEEYAAAKAKLQD